MPLFMHGQHRAVGEMFLGPGTLKESQVLVPSMLISLQTLCQGPLPPELSLSTPG